MSNVGVIAKGDPLEIPMEAWESIIGINLLGTVRRAALDAASAGQSER